MNPVSNYTKWLKLAAEYWSVQEKDIIGKRIISKPVVHARHTFYLLCLNDKIDLYQLSKLLNRHRTAIVGTMKNKNVSVTEHVNRILEDQIFAPIKIVIV